MVLFTAFNELLQQHGKEYGREVFDLTQGVT